MHIWQIVISYVFFSYAEIYSIDSLYKMIPTRRTSGPLEGALSLLRHGLGPSSFPSLAPQTKMTNSVFLKRDTPFIPLDHYDSPVSSPFLCTIV